MPRPPVLPAVDWRSVLDAGRTFADWLASAEDADKAERMREAHRRQPLAPHHEAALAALPRPVNVVAIAEDWCGDVVRHVPVLQRLADAAADRIHVRYLAREQHPDVFVRFLTNGGEAIPKFVFLSADLVECGSWGPMPEDCRRLIARGKACGDVGSARKVVSRLYQADPECRTVVDELMALIDIATTERLAAPAD